MNMVLSVPNAHASRHGAMTSCWRSRQPHRSCLAWRLRSHPYKTRPTLALDGLLVGCHITSVKQIITLLNQCQTLGVGPLARPRRLFASHPSESHHGAP